SSYQHAESRIDDRLRLRPTGSFRSGFMVGGSNRAGSRLVPFPTHRTRCEGERFRRRLPVVRIMGLRMNLGAGVSLADLRVAVLRAAGSRSIGRVAGFARPARIARTEAIAIAGVQRHAVAGAAGLAGGTVETGARSALQAGVVVAGGLRRA